MHALVFRQISARDFLHIRASELLENRAAYEKMAKAANPYGDGHTSERIVQLILRYFDESRELPALF